MKTKTKSCHCCSGSGKEIDSKSVGLAMKKLRQSSGLDQQAVAKKMGFTSTYLSLLESGHRNWSHPLMVAFRSACKP